MTERAPSAIATAAQLAAGTLDAATLLTETYARIDAVDGTLRAFTARLDLPTALAQLPALKARCRACRSPSKTSSTPANSPHATAPRSIPREPARFDAAIVSVIRRAGGLVIGKSSTTEFAFLNPTATLNPNAPGRTPGGSSAGSAAAVAAGLVPFAIGTQTGGSVIRPASYCGVTGFKPSFGLLPTPGLKCFSWSLDTVGLFAASVPEAAWFAAGAQRPGAGASMKPHPQNHGWSACRMRIRGLNSPRAPGKPWKPAAAR
jgi:Asp-tRNA(Asn)/Glu-tRNA(Gln) amidotransferase A subunit family amidase